MKILEDIRDDGDKTWLFFKYRSLSAEEEEGAYVNFLKRKIMTQ